MVTQSSRILFVTYGAGHADIVAKVIPVLSDIGRVRSSVIALTTAGSQLSKEGIRFKRCRDYLPLEGYERAFSLGEELSRAIWKPESGIPHSESCAYMGVSMCDLIAQYGEDRAYEIFKSQGRKAFLPIRFMKKVLAKENPDVVVTTCHVRMERAATLAAKECRVPTVLIDDLWGFSLLGEGPLSQVQPRVSCDEWPDHVCVLNEFVRNRLVEAGLDAHRVHVTGQPALSDWANRIEEAEPLERLRWLRDGGMKVVTYVAPARKDVMHEQIKLLIDIGRYHPDWHICIKLHPSVSVSEIQQRWGRTLEGITVIGAEDIVRVIKGSDVAVLFRSTVGLLCLFADVPLVIADWLEDGISMPYADCGAAWVAKESNQLEYVIQSALSQGTKSLDDRHKAIFENPPDAAKRAAQLLASVAQSRYN